MPFCTSCGKPLEDNSLFCEHCGARQEEPVSVGNAPPAAPSQQPSAPQQAAPAQSGYGAGASFEQPAAPAAPRKPIPKGVKIALIAVVAVVVLVALFMFIMGKVNVPQKTISSFVESILTQDYEQFSKVTCSASKELELTEDAVAPFFKLYSGNIGTLENYQDSLTTDLKRLQQGKAATGNGLVRLVERDHVLFKTYKVELSGTEISFAAPLDNTQVTVGGKTIDLKEAEEPYEVLLLPGLYDVEAACTNSVLGETFSTQLKNCTLTQSNDYWYINLEYTTVCLEDIGMEIASLTVNGKDYGPVEFDSWGEMNLFPLPADVEIEVAYDVDGVMLRDSFSWSGGYIWDTFYPNPTLDEETSRAMLDQVGAELRGCLDAFNSGDLDALQAMQCSRTSTVINNYIDQLEDSLDPDSYYRYVYTYSLLQMIGDLDWTREGGYGNLCFSTLVYQDMDYTYDFYLDGEFDETEGPYSNEQTVRAYMQLVNGKWVMVDLEWANYYDVGDMSNPYEI